MVTKYIKRFVSQVHTTKAEQDCTAELPFAAAAAVASVVLVAVSNSEPGQKLPTPQESKKERKTRIFSTEPKKNPDLKEKRNQTYK